MENKLNELLSKKKALSKTKYLNEFKKFAIENFGVADQRTQDFRKQCLDLGFDVVLSDGMSNDQVIKVLTQIGDKK